MDETSALRRGSVSVGLLWPFLRVARAPAEAIRLLKRHGIAPNRIVRPDARVECEAALEALDGYVGITGDDSIGARAGAAIELGDVAVAEYAGRCCENVREALGCWARYVRLLHDDAEIGLMEERGATLCVLRASDGLRENPVAAAFAVAAATTIIRRHAGLAVPAREIHLTSRPSLQVHEELRMLASSIRFGMAHNGIVLDPWQLEAAAQHPIPALRAVFSADAEALASRAEDDFRRRIRDVAASELATGRLSMSSAATALGVSPATLRRKLQEEHTTYRKVVDEVRSDLADRYLLDPGRSIGEIAPLLGFSYVSAFNKAFRRWKGTSPSEHRTRNS